MHAVQLVELQVDTETGEVKILKMTTSVDAGPVINPNNLTGQLEGGADMGVGLALREKYVARREQGLAQLQVPHPGHLLPPGSDYPRDPQAQRDPGPHRSGRDVHGAHRPRRVINGIKDAIGAFITDLPATPDKVLAALGKSES